MLLFGQKISQSKDIIASFMRLPTQELYDTANHYYRARNIDTASFCYKLLTKTLPQHGNAETLKKVMTSYFRLATLHGEMFDYRLAQEYYIKALSLCEKLDETDFESTIYTNMGNIYHRLNQKETAKSYYMKSYKICKDSLPLILLLNNMGSLELPSGNRDSALHYINTGLQISKQHNDKYLDALLNNLASYYQYGKQYDSAFYYFRVSLHQSRKNNGIYVESSTLSEIGKLFFEVRKIDSAQHYIKLSNKIASKNKFLNILADNYLMLSKIENSKGNYKSALQFHEQYKALQDSINNAEVYGSVNHLQRQYEVAKTDQQIEDLVLDSQVKENKLHYHRIILAIIIVALLALGSTLFVVFAQNRRLKKSYKILVNKNVEIMALDDELHHIKKHKRLLPKVQYLISTEPHADDTEKDSSCALSEKEQNELLKRILEEMDNTSIICNPDFSINKLADQLNSNQKYISYVINHALKQNFRSFLNTYRIKEAQRLFMELDVEKFTVNSVAQNVGFKSYSGFYYAFKEITGVNPNFYYNSVSNSRI